MYVAMSGVGVLGTGLEEPSGFCNAGFTLSKGSCHLRELPIRKYRIKTVWDIIFLILRDLPLYLKISFLNPGQNAVSLHFSIYLWGWILDFIIILAYDIP